MKTELNQLFTEWGADFIELEGVILPLRVGGVGEEYQAARDACAIFDGGDRGWLEMSGNDTADFLQRLLSSDIRELGAGGGQWSAALNGKAHWISDLLLFGLKLNDVDLVGIDMPASRQETLHQYFEKMHFSESLSWAAPPSARLLVAGPAARATLEKVGFAVADCGAPSCELIGELLVLQRPDRGMDCWELIGAPEHIGGLAHALKSAGAIPSGHVVLDILRVEAGIARWGIDFGESVTLPESNEWKRTSLSKGCYTGQEVVARINTYGEAPRQLCRVVFNQGVKPLHGQQLLDDDGKTAGIVSSWVYSPLQDCPLGLAVVAKRYARNNILLKVLGEDGDIIAKIERD